MLRAPGASPADKTKKGALENPEDEALGRSRGGFSTKVHLACDSKGRPLSVVLTPGQRHGRQHPARRTARGGAHTTPARHSRQAAQTPRTPDRRAGLELRRLPQVTAQARHLPHHPRAQGPERAPRRASGTPPWFRPGGLPAAQRGREVREQAQAVAWYSDALREAGGQLPGDGDHSCADDVAALMSRQTRPSRQPLVQQPCRKRLRRRPSFTTISRTRWPSRSSRWSV